MIKQLIIHRIANTFKRNCLRHSSLIGEIELQVAGQLPQSGKLPCSITDTLPRLGKCIRSATAQYTLLGKARRSATAQF